MPERIWRGVPGAVVQRKLQKLFGLFDLLARQNLDDGHLDLAEIVEADGRQRLGQRVGGRRLRRDVQGLQLGKLLLCVDAREQRRADGHGRLTRQQAKLAQAVPVRVLRSADAGAGSLRSCPA